MDNLVHKLNKLCWRLMDAIGFSIFLILLMILFFVVLIVLIVVFEPLIECVFYYINPSLGFD